MRDQAMTVSDQMLFMDQQQHKPEKSPARFLINDILSTANDAGPPKRRKLNDDGGGAAVTMPSVTGPPSAAAAAAAAASLHNFNPFLFRPDLIPKDLSCGGVRKPESYNNHEDDLESSGKPFGWILILYENTIIICLRNELNHQSINWHNR
jgi:hypothetical protein